MREFDYKITAKGDFVVIAFKGKISRENRDILQTCHQEMLSYEAKIIIIYFKDVEGVESGIFRELTLLQQDARKKNKVLFLVGLNSGLKQYLSSRGIIRLGEVGATLEEVLTKTKAA